MTEVTHELVVGVDGSEAAEHALRIALHEASVMREAVRVLHTWTVPAIATPLGSYGADITVYEAAGRTEAAAEMLAEIVRAARQEQPGLDVEVVQDAHQGDAGTELVRAADGADLLVLGARHHHGLLSAVLGSPTNYVLHHATCPVMVVPTSDAPVSGWSRVVVGVDGSEAGAAALRWGAARAAAHGCPLVAVHAWQLVTNPDWYGSPPTSTTGYARQVEHWLQAHVDDVLASHAPTVPVEVRAVQGQASSSLLDATPADALLVVGSRGRGGFADLVLGSVAMQCAHHARSAVTVVRAPKADAA